jgi:hypothetical protein
MAELNRRKAVVYVHPTTPNCCGKILPGIGPSTIEFATDSTRTITHIVFSGVATKFPDIRWIFSHSGGTLPFLTGRFKMLFTSAGLKVVDSGETAIVKGEVKQFFVTETKTYEAEVRVLVTVTDTSGKALWSGTSDGSAHRFGRSYAMDNYYEVLSDAVLAAVASLLKDEGFQNAAAGNR